MKRTRLNNRVVKALAVVVGGASLFALFPSCEQILTTVNPCGTVFGFCTPNDVEELFVTIPDYDYDPTCTIPGYGFDPAHVPTAGGCALEPVYPTTNGNRP